MSSNHAVSADALVCAMVKEIPLELIYYLCIYFLLKC